MAAVTPDVGTGTSIAFSTSFLGRLTSVRWTGISREALETTTMATTGGRDFIPGDLYDPGELQCEIQFDTDATPPISSAAETITITWPDAETAIFSGFMTGFEISDVLEQVMTATATIKITGDITW